MISDCIVCVIIVFVDCWLACCSVIKACRSVGLYAIGSGRKVWARPRAEPGDAQSSCRWFRVRLIV
jgi:hypothetical protein